MLEKLSNVENNISLMALDSNVDQGSLAEKINSLMPSIWIMVSTLASVLLLLIVLTKFMYNPVKKMVENRRDFIRKNINDSIEAKKKAFDIENQANQKLEESKQIGDNIITKAKIEADTIKNTYIHQAKQEATRIINEAKDEVRLRKEEFEKEAYNEILSVAMVISEKMIKDKISEKEMKRYLDEYLGNSNV